MTTFSLAAIRLAVQAVTDTTAAAPAAAPLGIARFTALLGTLYRTAFAAEPISTEEYGGWVRDLREAVDAPAA